MFRVLVTPLTSDPNDLAIWTAKVPMPPEEAPASPHLLKLSGFVLVAAGVLMAVATPLHPSRETATTIIASEVRLVAAHVLSTVPQLT